MDYIYRQQDTQVIIEEQRKQLSDSLINELIQLRKELHMTQQDVADRTGMKRANIARIEGKKYIPTLDVLMRYADSLGMQLDITVKRRDK